MRGEEFPLRPHVSGGPERGDGDHSLGVRVRRSEVLGLLEDVRTGQPVAADQRAAARHPQGHPSGRREYRELLRVGVVRRFHATRSVWFLSVWAFLITSAENQNGSFKTSDFTKDDSDIARLPETRVDESPAC